MSSSPKDTSPSEENKPKWTPGPWFIDWEPVGDEDVGVTGYEPSGHFVHGEPHSPNYVYLDRSANAHLIAAAPDLYEALDAVLQQYWPDDFPSDPIQFGVDHPAHMARVALAKARGEK
jgi:hypothetical protein